ncbi:DUF2931 family protein [Flavobacterium gelatinilyticum]|uniref:DUF2931 family protein n=1 Tax=Flavobacterium gelatinilyticum TaxID=3003260 RepID=UPI002480E519|nr:DUF2931 family protein [Flavobacterium gelatinilyticum]
MRKKKIFLLLLAITLSSCMEKKYKWAAYISAPREYPVEVYTGTVNGVYFSQMGGFSNFGWGSSGPINFIKAIPPDRLDITWLSYVDNKFYTGNWKLPTEKIKELFEKGFYYKPRDEAKIEAYDCINIGLGPKGMVVVWVRGSGHQIEVARYQAHETTIDPKLITESEKYMFEKDYTKDMLTYDGTIPKDLRKQIEQYGYPPPEVYESYREKYLWKPKVILPEGCKITSMYIKMCNGEAEDPYDRPIDAKHRALPYAFQIEWFIGSGKQKKEYISRIAFTDEAEYWAKYLKAEGEDEIPVDFYKNEIRKLFKEHIDKNKSTELVIKINPDVQLKSERVTDLYIEQEGKQYNIKEKVTRTGKLN